MTGLLFDPRQTRLQLWNTTFVPVGDAQQVAEALKTVHERHNYRAYNPYPGGTGSPGSARALVRLFVAPSEEGWTRIIGKPNLDLLAEVAVHLEQPTMYAWVSETDGGIMTFGKGSLEDYLREGITPDQLHDALQKLQSPVQEPSDQSGQAVAGDLADFAAQKGVNPEKANKLFNKTVNSFFKKMGNEDDSLKDEALSMVQRQATQTTSREPFQRLKTVIGYLSIPSGWHKPGFQELAEAFQIASLLDHDENAALLPGDEAILDRVEYPLDYQIAYYTR